MMVIPDLTQNRISIIHCPRTRGRGIVSRSRASNIRQCSKSVCQSRLQVCEGDRGSVRGSNGRRGEPTVRGEVLVVGYRRLEEIDYVAMVLVRWSVTGNVEGGITRPVFRELVAPEITIRTALGDPIPVSQSILASKPIVLPDSTAKKLR